MTKIILNVERPLIAGLGPEEDFGEDVSRTKSKKVFADVNYALSVDRGKKTDVLKVGVEGLWVCRGDDLGTEFVCPGIIISV